MSGRKRVPQGLPVLAVGPLLTSMDLLVEDLELAAELTRRKSADWIESEHNGLGVSVRDLASGLTSSEILEREGWSTTPVEGVNLPAGWTLHLRTRPVDYGEPVFYRGREILPGVTTRRGLAEYEREIAAKRRRGADRRAA